MGLLRALKRFFVGEPVPCEVCGTPTGDSFPVRPREVQSLCRQHLLEAAAAAYASFEYRFIVCQPHLEGSAGCMYPYYPADQMLKEFSFPKNIVAHVRSLLGTIEGHDCNDCGDEARSLYFSIVTYDRNGQRLEDLDAQNGEYLCREHAFARIRPALDGNTQSFSEGLWAPYGGEGIAVSTFV